MSTTYTNTYGCTGCNDTIQNLTWATTSSTTCDTGINYSVLWEEFQKHASQVQQSMKEEKQAVIDKLKGERSIMDIMKNIHFGPCGAGAKISHLGIAVKNLDGRSEEHTSELQSLA